MMENLERVLRKMQAEISLDDSRNAAIHDSMRGDTLRR
jgi:hypothetical protein